MNAFHESCPIRVACAIIIDQQKILITRRPVQVHLGGLWEFPGGKIHSSETLVDCLHREIKEELGIEIEILDFIERCSHEYLTHPKELKREVELHFYLCKIRTGKPQAYGVESFKWIEAKELSQYSFPPADQNLIERLPKIIQCLNTNS